MTDSTPESSAHEERLVAEAFTAFSDGNRVSFPPPPIEDIYKRARLARHQRRYRTALAAAAALTLVVGLITLSSLVGGDRPRPSAEGTPTATASPPDSTASSRPRSPGPSDGTKNPGSENPPRPGGSSLANARVEIAAMNGCGGGDLRFASGEAVDAGGCAWRLGYADPWYANLDGGTKQEVITTVFAGGGTGVVALRVPPQGTLTTMGYVVVANPGTQAVDSIAVSGDGLISVDLSDTRYGARSPQRQTRGYRWASSARAFIQVEGPDSFPSPNPGPSGPEASISPSTNG